ncbi:hypothetical protein GCM10028803_27990 [Larkinella knui]|uniref:PKD domain-containing protein n=1 Tax=Larkinella knui TaxID=2025310 RepID=A0A3P1CX83_9BACT|nr:hypothetical protein [Larkinella knui]RRB17839.1 hypothetical protein EHT87_06050 [Larkinella knui]
MAGPFSILAAPVPTLTASNNGILSCDNPTLTLTAGGGIAYAFYGPGSDQIGTATTYTVNQASTYPVIVTAENGCTARVSIAITDKRVPLITTQPTSASTVHLGESISVPVVAQGSPLTYQPFHLP